ncbi:MAG: hypothetical protein NVS3B10_00380 [Polyangiales bacterium]
MVVQVAPARGQAPHAIEAALGGACGMSATNRGVVRAIPGWHGYFAGADGKIYSEKAWRGVAWREISAAGRDRDGYPRVQLSPGRGHLTVSLAVHRLIAVAWLGPRPSAEHQVCHLDGDRTNNAPANLRWGTAKDNADDRERHGRTSRGERSGASKLTESEARQIKSLVVAGANQSAIARQVGVCVATVNHIATGRNWGWL